MIQDETRNRSAQDRSDGYADHEERKGTRLFALGKPVREVQNDSREIPGFSQPQHKARNVKLLHRMDEARQHSHKSPSKQDSGDPDARSDLVQQQIAGDFKKEVAKKENPENESELLAADGQLFVHCERGKPNVVAINECNDEKHKNKWENPEAYFLDSSGADGHRVSSCFNGHNHLAVDRLGQIISSAGCRPETRKDCRNSMRRRYECQAGPASLLPRCLARGGILSRAWRLREA